MTGRGVIRNPRVIIKTLKSTLGGPGLVKENGVWRVEEIKEILRRQ